jgi:hypothetical protein
MKKGRSRTYYAHWYEKVFDASRFGDCGPGDGPGWDGPDDEEDDWEEWVAYDAGYGPLPASALPEGEEGGEGDQARERRDGAA